MKLWRCDNSEEIEISDDQIIEGYTKSRFYERYASVSVGLSIYITDREEGLQCTYQTNNPEFKELVNTISDNRFRIKHDDKKAKERKYYNDHKLAES